MPADFDLADAITTTQSNLTATLSASLQPNGSWRSELADSALATAVATFALAQVDICQYRKLIESGLNWIAANNNADGGWGDTTASRSNLSTTLLCWLALSVDDRYREAVTRAESWLRLRITDLAPETIRRAVVDYYGKKTEPFRRQF